MVSVRIAKLGSCSTQVSTKGIGQGIRWLRQLYLWAGRISYNLGVKRLVVEMCVVFLFFFFLVLGCFPLFPSFKELRQASHSSDASVEPVREIAAGKIILKLR